MNPLHSDLNVLYAEMLAANDENEAACAILERLAIRNDSPIYVYQWLGYYLRFLPWRLDDAIRYSQKYHELFPDESDSFFNIGYAYLLKYCIELRASEQQQILSSANRTQALDALKKGLRSQPEMKERIRSEWLTPGGGLECMAKDPDLTRILERQIQAAE